MNPKRIINMLWDSGDSLVMKPKSYNHTPMFESPTSWPQIEKYLLEILESLEAQNFELTAAPVIVIGGTNKLACGFNISATMQFAKINMQFAYANESDYGGYGGLKKGDPKYVRFSHARIMLKKFKGGWIRTSKAILDHLKVDQKYEVFEHYGAKECQLKKLAEFPWIKDRTWPTYEIDLNQRKILRPKRNELSEPMVLPTSDSYYTSESTYHGETVKPRETIRSIHCVDFVGISSEGVISEESTAEKNNDAWVKMALEFDDENSSWRHYEEVIITDGERFYFVNGSRVKTFDVPAILKSMNKYDTDYIQGALKLYINKKVDNIPQQEMKVS